MEQKRLELENRLHELSNWLDKNVSNKKISDEEYEKVGDEYRAVKGELYKIKKNMTLR